MAQTEQPQKDTIPQWLWDPFLVCDRRLKDESWYLHLTMRGLSQLEALPKVLASLETTGKHIENAHAPHGVVIEDARRDAAWVKRESSSGFPLLHAHSVVGVWSAIEVFAEDLAMAWLRNVPPAWEVPEVAKLKIPVGRFQQLSAPERAAFVVSELSRTFAPEVRRGVGQLKAILGVFNLWPTVGPNLQKALHELCQVRNVLVHCAGRTDQRLVDECPWLGTVVGKEIAVPHALYSWYLTAARLLADRAFNQATLALGLPGCTCPGLDEVQERPVEQLGAPSRPTIG